MAPPNGNQFWKLRSKHGRDKLFAEPALLREACEEYFEWVEANPLSEARIFCSKDGIRHGNVDKMRAMTLSGLCIFLDINQQTWRDWRKGKDKDYTGIIARADEIIRTQKFVGAAADLLNANIIARELNLRDGTDSTVTEVKPIEFDIDLDILTDEEFKIHKEIIGKLADEAESRRRAKEDIECGS